MSILSFILVLIVLIVVVYYSFPIIQVCGDSMYPTYKDGEYLVGFRFLKNHLKEGDVVVALNPFDDMVIIKRVSYIEPVHHGLPSLYLLGDNPEVSYDSRHYGLLSSKYVICKVINQRRKVQ